MLLFIGIFLKKIKNKKKTVNLNFQNSITILMCYAHYIYRLAT